MDVVGQEPWKNLEKNKRWRKLVEYPPPQVYTGDGPHSLGIGGYSEEKVHTFFMTEQTVLSC